MKKGRPTTKKKDVPRSFIKLYPSFCQGYLTKTELAKQSGISYNSMIKYLRIMNEVDDSEDDEYYTSYKDVDNELSRYIEYFNGKNIYCPCDSKESNIVKWLQDNTTANITYSNDNFFNHANLFKASDIIITNPPFSFFKSAFEFFRSYEKDMFLICPLNSIRNSFLNNLIIRGNVYIDRPCKQFERPDGSKKEILSLWISTVNPSDYTR